MICAPSRSAWRSKSRPNFRKNRSDAEARARRDDSAEAATQDRAEDRAGHRSALVLGRLAGLRRPVAKHHVADLVGHHAGDFAFVLGRFEHAAVDEHRAARQRERVDLANVHHLEGVVELRVAERLREWRRRAGARRLPRTTSLHRRA